MPPKGIAKDANDPRVAAAVRISLRCEQLKVPEAMRAAEFTIQDSKDPNKQKWIRRRIQKSKSTKITSSIIIDSPASMVSSITTPSTSTLTTDEPSCPPPKKKKSRQSSKNKQKERYNNKSDMDHFKKAHKLATKTYAVEKKKRKGKSSEAVESDIKKEYGVAPSARTIRREVENGRAGMSPQKRGNRGEIQDYIFDTLANAFASYVQIKQLNGKGGDNTRTKLRQIVNKVMGKDTNALNFKLLDRLLTATAVSLHADKMNDVEQRRILWTTYKNLKMWFENWERELEELGFTKRNESDGHYIPQEQLGNIINLDETCLSLDGSKGNRGGRPEVTFFDPKFPQLGKGTSKTSLTTTMIGGSTAAGEALPPHFQFQTSAQSDETTKMRAQLVEFMPDIRGKFGCEEEKRWPVSYGLNKEGGMNEKEFYDYIMGSIVPLFPDAKDVKGKRVMIKVDSGPGRLYADLLATLRLLGFYLYPGVPNTTAVTQETDRNYGPFKTQFRKNLDLIVSHRNDAEPPVPVNLQPWLVGLVVFGGTDPATGYVVVDSAFEVGFSREMCLKAWAKIGAAPMSRACLTDSKVRRELGDGDEDMDAVMLQVQSVNDFATYTLTQNNFDGHLLKATLEKTKKNEAITLPHTQARVEALAHSKTHGAKFYVTGGSHATSDDVFKSMEIEKREKDIADMEKVKETRLKRAKNEQDGLAAFETGRFNLPVVDNRQWPVPLLDAILLHWHGKESTKGLKGPKITAVCTIYTDGIPPPTIDKWTTQDDAALVELQKKEISMGDTALGRLVANKKREMYAAVDKMDSDERQNLKRKLAELESSAPEPLLSAPEPHLSEESAPESLPTVPVDQPPIDPPSEKVSANDQHVFWLLDLCKSEVSNDDSGVTISCAELAGIATDVVRILKSESSQYVFDQMEYSRRFRKSMKPRDIGRVTDDFICALARKCDDLLKDEYFTSDSVRRAAVTYSP